jgi:hypothetical protein
MARQTEQQKRNQAQRNRDLLLASTTYNLKGGGLYNKTSINDGDPSVYTAAHTMYGRTVKIGPGPANPNPFWQREKEETVTEAQYIKDMEDAAKRADAEKAKKLGFPSVTAMYQAEHKKQKERQAADRLKAQRQQLENEKLRAKQLADQRAYRNSPEYKARQEKYDRDQIMLRLPGSGGYNMEGTY